MSASSGPRRDVQVPRSNVFSGHVRCHLEHHLDVALVLSGVGARGRAEWPSGVFTLVHGQPVLTSRTHDCVPVALSNSVFAVCGAKSAEVVSEVVEKYPGVLETLRQIAGILVNGKISIIGCRIMLDRELNQELQKVDRLVSFEAITGT